MPVRHAPAGLRPELTRPYRLDRLAGTLGTSWSGPESVAVTGVAFDSRSVHPGDLYVGLPGARTHGALFAPAARDLGAVGMLTDAVGARMVAAGTGTRMPLLQVADPRRAMAAAAAEVYGRPADRLTMIGVTGTNGKTTTADLLAVGLRSTGRRCGVIGTLGYFVGDEEIPADRTTITTPESPDLQALLAIMAERGADSVVMEVSSHALALDRVDEITYQVAGFTNLGRDHLDFHGSERAYYEAKARLFAAGRSQRAVINIDDPRGPDLVSRARAAGLEVATTSLTGRPGIGVDHYRCLCYDVTVDPVAVRLQTPDRELHFRLGIPGSYNVANAITALAMLDRIGINIESAVRGLETVAVPGRLQRVELSGGPKAYVDFAHTPQAIRSVLAELSATLSDGKLITVVGCGGDRDPAKRGPMGAAAAELSDLVIVTDDNPRTEDPAVIRAAALAGAREQAARQRRPVRIVDGGDRAAAIRLALSEAGGGDVIAVLGKGHERGQEINGAVLPFDDAEELVTGWQEAAKA